MPYERLARLGMGLLALGMLLAAEFAAVLKLRSMSFSEYMESIDPVSGTAYYFMLGLYAIMPLLVERR